MRASLETKPKENEMLAPGVNKNNSIGRLQPNLADSENAGSDQGGEIFLDPEAIAKGLHQEQESLNELKNTEPLFDEDRDEQLVEDKNEDRSPIIKFLIKNRDKLNVQAMKFCYGGIGIHQLAALSPLVKFIPKSISNLFEKGATLYSRILSGLPAAIFAIDDLKEKNIVPMIGKLSATLSFPLIETVENMPVASSLFCGINTALEAIEEYKGEKVTRKSNSFFHQLEEFGINYARAWKDSLNKLGDEKTDAKDKFKSLFNLVSLPGYSLVQGVGMILCRDRMADTESDSLKNKVAIGIRTLRAVLGIATDFFLLGSEKPSQRRVGATFVASSVLSLFPPWAHTILKGQSQETIDNWINVFGQECKSLDELGNALWAKAKQAVKAPSLEEEMDASIENQNDFAFAAMPA
ncbi:MAG: hypothetical protein MK033_12045 [Candidatus Caenarcaniphilales bacterium]|nr:hypothetical protein [Candidatus Caenarcaniphilales bacterium]